MSLVLSKARGWEGCGGCCHPSDSRTFLPPAKRFHTFGLSYREGFFRMAAACSPHQSVSASQSFSHQGFSSVSYKKDAPWSINFTFVFLIQSFNWNIYIFICFAVEWPTLDLASHPHPHLINSIHILNWILFVSFLSFFFDWLAVEDKVPSFHSLF